VTLRNDGEAAYRDLRYVCFYRDAAGALLSQSGGYLPEVVQPGETRRIEGIVDGSRGPEIDAAEMRLVGGDRLVPIAAVTSSAMPR
jgi:hypothetical protein